MHSRDNRTCISADKKHGYLDEESIITSLGKHFRTKVNIQYLCIYAHNARNKVIMIYLIKYNINNCLVLVNSANSSDTDK